MMATLRSEVRKLLSVRSTYVICLITWLLVAIFAFWVEGYKGLTPSATSLANDQAIKELVVNGASTAGGFLAIIAILFIVHEYRYNMIMYTLTASRSRSKVLISKLLVISVFAVLFTMLTIGFTYACYAIGLSLRNVALPVQDWNVLTTVGKVMFYNLAMTLIGFMVGLGARNIAGAVGFLFLFPNIVEPLLGLLIKENAVYLPFAALERVITTTASQSLTQGSLSPAAAMGVVSLYLVPGMIISWILFLKRDAN